MSPSHRGTPWERDTVSDGYRRNIDTHEAVAGRAVVSSIAAPVFLVGGWLTAQAAQPSFDPVSGTISALARHGLDHRWIMTVGLAGLGVAHVVTASGLRTVRPVSRVVLAVAGIATVLVAVFAQPYRGTSTAHEVSATIGFVALALWPVSTATREGSLVVRPGVAAAASVVSSGLLIWLAATLGGDSAGLSERILTAQQALWPLVVVFGLRRT